MSEEHVKPQFPEPRVEYFGTEDPHYIFGVDKEMFLRLEQSDFGWFSIHFDVNSDLDDSMSREEKRARARIAINGSLEHMLDFLNRKESGKSVVEKMKRVSLSTTTKFLGEMFEGFKSPFGEAEKSNLVRNVDNRFNWKIILDFPVLAAREDKQGAVNGLLSFMQAKNKPFVEK